MQIITNMSDTPWVKYVATVEGAGTLATNNIWSRKSGSDLLIMGYIVTGTPTAVSAYLTLGFNGVDGNGIQVAAWPTTGQHCGEWNYSNYGQAGYSRMIITQAQPTKIGFALANTPNGWNATLIRTGSAMWAAADTLTINARVPILGW